LYVDASLEPAPHENAGANNEFIDVQWTRQGSPVTNILFTPSLKKNLLRVEDLYGKSHGLVYNPKGFDYVLRFTSGAFCCSNVKPRRFAECNLANGLYVGKSRLIEKSIAHDVLVLFDMQDKDELRLVRSDQVTLFDSTQLQGSPKYFEIQFLSDNSTAVKYYKDSLSLPGPNYWVPNQGDPPPGGLP
jgi:hypothetical protein